VDRDEVLVLDGWRLDPETVQIAAGFEAPHDLSHGGRIGNLTTTKGSFDLSRPVRRHERLRLRLVNAANARIFVLGLDGLEGWTVALDGMPLVAPEPVAEPFPLGPGQRADLIVDVTAEAGAERIATSGARAMRRSRSRSPEEPRRSRRSRCRPIRGRRLRVWQTRDAPGRTWKAAPWGASMRRFSTGAA
jgi:FtsP/CotA-like multicopper oxidase with cupredoxin domain